MGLKIKTHITKKKEKNQPYNRQKPPNNNIKITKKKEQTQATEKLLN